MPQQTIPLYRDIYGALDTLPNAERAHANELLALAIKCGKLDKTYDKTVWHRRHGKLGWLLTYDFYDINASSVLVQRRETECTKYGNSPTKSYYIVRRCGRGVIVTEAPKSRVVKLAKASTELGQVIATLNGKATRPLKLPSPFAKKQLAYKIVEHREDGSLYSVFDDEFEWKLGKARIEAATSTHEGGFYVFDDVATALAALEQGVVFVEAWARGKALALVECETAGRRHFHDNGKICVSFCRPIRVLQQLSAAA